MSKNTLHVMQSFDKMCETGCASWKKVKTFVINMRDKTNKCFCFTVKAHICDDQGPCCFLG